MSIEEHKFSDGGLIARVAYDDNVALYDIITNDKFGISKKDAYALAKHFGLIDEWVSVDDAMPKEAEPVLVYGNCGYYFLCEYIGGCWRIMPSYQRVIGIEYWKPITPPKEKTK